MLETKESLAKEIEQISRNYLSKHGHRAGNEVFADGEPGTSLVLRQTLKPDQISLFDPTESSDFPHLDLTRLSMNQNARRKFSLEDFVELKEVVLETFR